MSDRQRHAARAEALATKPGMVQILNSPHDQADVPIAFSIVMVTYARDEIAADAIQHVATAANGRRDIQFILVDNNPDAIDRTSLLAPFERWTYVKLGFNKGVSARNDGALAARGTFIVFIDDDTFLQPAGAFDTYERDFAEHPGVAIVTARNIDFNTGQTLRAAFPHTDKQRAQDQPFKTFRFQGSGFAMRRSAFQKVGPMSKEFFYGLEELDYAYRVVNAGYEIFYEPAIQVVEHNHPGGRRPKKAVQEMNLTNKMIISFKHMPVLYLPINIALFSAYMLVLNRGRLNVIRSFWNFLSWAVRNVGERRPLTLTARAYIRDCGGQVWK
ncbi:MAG: glycosyltransferase [Acidobacteriota bacterium]